MCSTVCKNVLCISIMYIGCIDKVHSNKYVPTFTSNLDTLLCNKDEFYDEQCNKCAILIAEQMQIMIGQYKQINKTSKSNSIRGTGQFQ